MYKVETPSKLARSIWLWTNYTSQLVVHEALACSACPWFITLITVVEIVGVAIAHRCSGLD